MIQVNHYSQLHDYLSQILRLSNQGGLPKITYTLVAEKLNISSPPTISSFINRTTKKPFKVLANFKTNYPLEFQQWPNGSQTIERVLQVRDAMLFLRIAVAQPPVALPLIVQQPPVALPVRKRFVIAPLTIKAPIAISCRGHLSAKDGDGMLFDHMRVQDITKFPTAVLAQNNPGMSTVINKIFVRTLKNHTAKLPFGVPNQDLITCPPFIHDFAESGLLIVPGRVRKVEDEPERLKHEYRVIRDALNRGQPILGICAGSWRIFEQLTIWTQHSTSLNAGAIQLLNWHKKNSTLIDVNDHCYGGGMIRLDTSGVQATLNVQIHNIVVEPSSLLKRGLGAIPPKISVNSVHWKAVNQGRLPPNVRISAVAERNALIQKNTRQGVLMEPQENTVEAFESEAGAPIMGIQWHPEGYHAGSSHGSLLKYMALAGNAYAAKRRMLKEFTERTGKAGS